MYNPSCKEEEIYLQSYDISRYPQPSVTADIVLFLPECAVEHERVSVLLIKRGNYPYKGKWALPGGFVNLDETCYEGALRELQEETGINDIFLHQMVIADSPDRDPRGRIISVPYWGEADRKKISLKSGDDAADAQLFQIVVTNDQICEFVSEKDGSILSEQDLAFDHRDIISSAFTNYQHFLNN